MSYSSLILETSFRLNNNSIEHIVRISQVPLPRKGTKARTVEINKTSTFQFSTLLYIPLLHLRLLFREFIQLKLIKFSFNSSLIIYQRYMHYVNKIFRYEKVYLYENLKKTMISFNFLTRRRYYFQDWKACSKSNFFR